MCDLDPDPVTLILKPDLDIINIPKMKFLHQQLQKLSTDTETHRQTDRQAMRKLYLFIRNAIEF